jgi:hypothetical protein
VIARDTALIVFAKPTVRGEGIRRVSWCTNESEPRWRGLPLGSLGALLTAG